LRNGEKQVYGIPTRHPNCVTEACMKILILGINYQPEPVGIGPYTADMARSLVAAGHEVAVVCGKPYYPHWRVEPGYAGPARRTVEDGVRVTRVPLHVPKTPTGLQRVIHHASFTLSAQMSMLAAARRQRPDVVIAIAPSLISTVAARITARLSPVSTNGTDLRL